MCGRYVSPDQAAIESQWRIGRVNSNPFRRRTNVIPTTRVPLIRSNPATAELELTEARWGLIPGWWKKAKPPTLTINARSEEAAGKPMWRHPYRHSRCLIPALGWYEWKPIEAVDVKTGEIHTYKQPFYIFPRDRRPVCFAGLMSMWVPEGGGPVLTCAILTKAASISVAIVHDRMPVVLPDSAFGVWLDPDRTKSDAVAEIIADAQADFEHYPVSTRINSSKGDDDSFNEPLAMAS